MSAAQIYPSTEFGFSALVNFLKDGRVSVAIRDDDSGGIFPSVRIFSSVHAAEKYVDSLMNEKAHGISVEL
jgi:hypothetical protein